MDAVVFAASPLAASPRLRSRLAAVEAPYVVAADNGALTAFAFGYTPDLVVGDLDSLEESTLTELRLRKVPIETHPRDKDATDGQLAVERAVERQPAHLWLLGFLGGPRLDQTLANVLLLAGLETTATVLDEHNECVVLRPGHIVNWHTEPDEVVSLIPWGADAHGVHTQGLRWPLQNATLRLGDTRGISNEPLAAEASVSLTQGLVLVTRHFPTG